MPPAKTGFYADKDVRAVAAIISSEQKPMVLVSNNANSLTLLQNHQSQINILPLRSMDAWASITYANGKKVKCEFKYGSGYLTQSTRNLVFNNKVKKVVIYDYVGNFRKIFLDQIKNQNPI